MQYILPFYRRYLSDVEEQKNQIRRVYYKINLLKGLWVYALAS